MRLDHLPTAIALLCLTGIPCISVADELPALRQGKWEYNRTVEDSQMPGKPVSMTSSKCADPTAGMKKKNAALAQSGCKFSPAVKNGNDYVFTSECTIQGVSMKTRSVMTVESDSAYKVDITSTAGARTTKEVLVAKRIGDC